MLHMQNNCTRAAVAATAAIVRRIAGAHYLPPMVEAAVAATAAIVRRHKTDGEGNLMLVAAVAATAAIVRRHAFVLFHRILASP